MKTLFVDNVNKPVIYDHKKDDCYHMDEIFLIETYRIKYMYVVPEDMQIKTRLKGKSDHIVKNASKGDILIQFCEFGDDTGGVAVIKNKDLCSMCDQIVENRKHVRLDMELNSCKCQCDNVR